MRDRLIELLKSSAMVRDLYSMNEEELFRETADHLLANGVIVPPCKVGDVVYVNPKTWGGILFINYDNLFIRSKYFLVAEVVSVIKTRKQNLIKLKVYNRTTYTSEDRRYPVSSIGKTVFLTREEAERALKNATDNNVGDKGGDTE